MNRATARRRLGQNAFICYSKLVNNTVTQDASDAVWGPYPNYADVARFEYGRRLWRSPEMRSRFLRHWTDPRHPYRDRFKAQRGLIEEVLGSQESEARIDQGLRNRGTSLRCVAREIPPVFGSFF